MSVVSIVLGLFIAGLGMLSIASAETFFEFLRHFQSPRGMYFGAGFRLILGISLLVSAKKSRIPEVVRVLGWVFLVAGLLVPIFGFELLSSAIDSFVSLGRWGARVWGAIALALGLFIAYMIAPTFRAT